MAVQIPTLYRLEDLENTDRTTGIADGDLRALRSVADWIRAFVVKPHQDLGRAGPVCPFVPEGLERGTVWLVPEHIVDRTVPDLVRLMNDYKEQLVDAEPTEGDGVQYKAIMIVLTDLSADRAPDYLNDDQVQGLKQPAYADDGVVLGEFHRRTREPRFTTRASVRSDHPCPSCSSGTRSPVTGCSSWTATTGSACGLVASVIRRHPRWPRSYAGQTGGASTGDRSLRGRRIRPLDHDAAIPRGRCHSRRGGGAQDLVSH